MGEISERVPHEVGLAGFYKAQEEAVKALPLYDQCVAIYRAMQAEARNHDSRSEERKRRAPGPSSIGWPFQDPLEKYKEPTQPPTPASGEQMAVVAYKGQSGALYLPHHGDPKEDVALVTLEAAQREIAEADADAEAWGKALKAAEALNKTLSEALKWYASPEAWTIDQVEGPDGDYGRRASAALAAQPAKQGGQS